MPTTDPNPSSFLEQMIEPETCGDPQSLLWWARQSTCALAEELKRYHHAVGYVTVGQLLREHSLGLQSNRKLEPYVSSPGLLEPS